MSEFALIIFFSCIIILFLVIDLGLLHRTPKKITTQSALYQSIFWVLISLFFCAFIFKFYGGVRPSMEFLSAYLTEKALSVDNIFVIILILKYFKVDEVYYHKILFWGILGAIVFRAIFIFLGAFLVMKFYWILYIFGAFLVYSGIKLMTASDDDETLNPGDSPVIKFFRKHLSITKGHFGGKFIIKRGSKILFTPLFLVLIFIECTDLIFAVDSIPAAFAITTNQFILFSANIFAIMGLRAMFFLLAGILDKFFLLQKGLAIILIFIGAKMLLEIFSIHIPVGISLAVISASLFLSIALSLVLRKCYPQVLPEAD